MPIRPLPEDAATFVRECLGEEWTAEGLAGDASTRAYFRITGPDGLTYMLAYYPEEVRPQLRRFLQAYRAVAAEGRPPEVLRYCEYAVLQRDVGDRTLFALIHENRKEGLRLYRRAIDLLVAFQRSAGDEINPPFTASFFFDELEMSRQYYVEGLMGMPAAEAAVLTAEFERLSEKLGQHPYVLCHRDYHGQNIHVLNGEIFLIDFQDLRLGPDTYDLASLLRDRGVAAVIGDDAEIDLLGYYGDRRGAYGGVRQRYFEALLQRSIKILGTFAKQPIVRGRMHYLEFIPPTIASIRRCLRELPEFDALTDILPMEFSLSRSHERAVSLHKESQV